MSDTDLESPPAESAPAFPDAPHRGRGYEKRAVEAFLGHARAAFELGDESTSMTSADIRHVAFPIVKRGYSIAAVDAALGRIEDAFAARERERAFAETGDAAWYATARASAQEILNRLARPAGQRFTRTGIFTNGYDTKAVDAFAERLVGYFQNGKPMSVEQVRAVAFPAKKRGYNEAQVDLLLDSVIDVMLAVR